MSDGLEQLLTDGFSFEEVSIFGAGFSADYGDGYAESARTGHADGLREWKCKVTVLPDDEEDIEYMLDGGEQGPQTHFRYLFDFYVRHNVANIRKPFRFRDPVSRQEFLAEIVEQRMSYQIFNLTAYSTGLTIRQRRIFGVATPIEDTGNNAEM
jgi:hypothetical protein